MHKSAREYGKAFFQNYITKIDKPIIVEIGSQDVNGSFRNFAPKESTYIGLDFAQGKSVDIVLTDEYKFPFPDNYSDFVVTSSCFEHSQFFWLSFLEAMRILKPSGVIYINAPSNGAYHSYPTDNWRFYPDAGKAFTKYARFNGYKSVLLESFIGAESENWRDFLTIILKDDSFTNKFPTRIYNTVSNSLSPTNVFYYGNENYICKYDDFQTEYVTPNEPLDCSHSGKNLKIFNENHFNNYPVTTNKSPCSVISKNNDVCDNKTKEAEPLKSLDKLLIESVYSNNYHAAKFLIQKGANPNVILPFHDGNLLIIAVVHGLTDIANLLLLSGSDTNKYSGGLQAIHKAILNQDIKMIKLLLKHGVDIHSNSYLGTPLQQAIKLNNIELINLLIDFGAMSIVPSNQESYTIDILKNAIIDGNFFKAKNIIESNKKLLDKLIEDNPYLLVDHVLEGNLNIVKYLVENGYDVNSISKNNIPALLLATLNSYSPLIEYLLEKGANPNSSTNNYTSLKLAIGNNNANHVKLLLKYGSDFLNDTVPNIFYLAHHSESGDNEIGQILYNHYIDYLIKNPPVYAPKDKTFEVVIVRYNEDLEWAKYEFDKNVKVTIYNKGADDLDTPDYFNIIKTENTGYLGGSFIKHIINRYDTLADRTLFLQGYPYDAQKFLPLIRYSNITETSCKNIYAAACTTTTLEFQNNWLSNSGWENTKYNKFIFNKNIINFVNKYIGNIPLDKEFTATYGAEFSVDKEKILCHSKDFYETLFNESFNMQFPGDDHFMERTWDLLLDC